MAKKAQLELNADPRPLDRAMHNRIRLMVEHDAIDRAWGSMLYILHRTGKIDNDQREAGDRYWELYNNFVKTQQIDPDDCEIAKEFTLKRIKRDKRRFQEARESMGIYYNSVHDLVWHDLWPQNLRKAWLGLSRLSKFFLVGGTKRQQNVV